MSSSTGPPVHGRDRLPMVMPMIGSSSPGAVWLPIRDRAARRPHSCQSARIAGRAHRYQVMIGPTSLLAGKTPDAPPCGPAASAHARRRRPAHGHPERCPSGLRNATGNRVSRFTGPWVRIPPSPLTPHVNRNVVTGDERVKSPDRHRVGRASSFECSGTFGSEYPHRPEKLTRQERTVAPPGQGVKSRLLAVASVQFRLRTRLPHRCLAAAWPRCLQLHRTLPDHGTAAARGTVPVAGS